MARDIKESRAEIDALNRELVEKFCRRMDVAADVADYKREHGLPIYDPAREREILADMAHLAGEDYRDYVKTFFTVMMDLSKARQAHLLAARAESRPEGASARILQALESTPSLFPDGGKVACMSAEGACGQLAANRLFSLPDICCYGTFGEVFEAVERGDCDFGVFPIESSTRGTVNEVSDLLQAHRVCIVRSVKLHREPIAGGNTRFICIAKDLKIFPDATKISLMLTLPHESGALYTTLAKFTAQGVNLTKLESRPMEDCDQDMRFYCDFEGSPAEERIRRLLDDLEGSCETFAFLGGYREI